MDGQWFKGIERSLNSAHYFGMAANPIVIVRIGHSVMKIIS